MYGSHDMRHTVFRRLTVVNGTPGVWGGTDLGFKGFRVLGFQGFRVLGFLGFRVSRF